MNTSSMNVAQLKKIQKEKGISDHHVYGTGQGGRKTKQDRIRAIQSFDAWNRVSIVSTLSVP